jgi:hypothetical protein
VSSPGAPRQVVDAYKDIAGGGTLDERCARIMGHWRCVGVPWESPSWLARLVERREVARTRMAA